MERGNNRNDLRPSVARPSKSTLNAEVINDKAICHEDSVVNKYHSERNMLQIRLGTGFFSFTEKYNLTSTAVYVLDNTAAQKAFIGVLVLLLTLLLAFVTLFAVRYDSIKGDTDSLSWSTCFSPLWAAFGIVIPVAAYTLQIGIKADRFDQFFYSVSVVMAAVASVFWLRALEGSSQWKVCFAFVVQSLMAYTIAELIIARPSFVLRILQLGRKYEKLRSSASQPRHFVLSTVYLKRTSLTIVNLACLATFIFLLRSRFCDPDSSVSFYLVFTPLFLRLTGPIITLILSLVSHRQLANTKANCSSTSHKTSRLKLGWIICHLTFYLAVAFTFAMISYKLNTEWDVERVAANGSSISALACVSLLMAALCGWAALGAYCLVDLLLTKGIQWPPLFRESISPAVFEEPLTQMNIAHERFIVQ